MFSSTTGLMSNWFLFTTETWNRLLERFKTPDTVIKEINCLVWKSVVDNYFISDIGLVKRQIKPNKSFYTFGRTNSSGYSYLPKFYNSIGTGLIHRVVATIFLNNGVPLKDNQLVDHINTKRNDNSVNNLKICDGMSENLSNEITRRKITIPVKFTNELTGKTVYFCSRSDCMKRIGTKKVERWITSNNPIKLDETLPKIMVNYISEEELMKYRNLEISFEFPDINSIDDLKKLII